MFLETAQNYRKQLRNLGDMKFLELQDLHVDSNAGRNPITITVTNVPSSACADADKSLETFSVTAVTVIQRPFGARLNHSDVSSDAV
ncbi:hypothetical protein EVAR_30461_1 [Eumeta japonica]|uniref:Uncharacterized protein n=1 Tax=Eumeta variegata TaxID=151549 RepID=A0A4C1W013_EUMVA|nr:hypothetical protein EVAR_30461_1 [Eumeta japonica]